MGKTDRRTFLKLSSGAGAAALSLKTPRRPGGHRTPGGAIRW